MTLTTHGRRVALALIQDAVLIGLSGSELPTAQHLQELVNGGTDCHYLADDLAMRGYDPRDIARGCVAVTYEALVDLLLADDVCVSGSF